MGEYLPNLATQAVAAPAQSQPHAQTHYSEEGSQGVLYPKCLLSGVRYKLKMTVLVSLQPLSKLLVPETHSGISEMFCFISLLAPLWCKHT